MFKKIMLTVCAVALSVSAQAAPVKKTSTPVATTNSSNAPVYQSGFFFKPYVGADYQFTGYGNEDIAPGVKSDDLVDTTLHGGNIHVGARVHKNLGVELGYFKTEKGNNRNAGLFAGETKFDVQGVTLDALGFYPVTPSVELIGTAGVSYSKASIGGTAIAGVSDEKDFGARIGAGAQYWFCNNMNVRGLVRYDSADFDDSVDGAVVGTVGVNYQF